MAEGMMGYVYLITNVRTGKKYLGKKFFTFSRSRKPLKGKKRTRRDRVESDWKEYWGSSNALLEDVEKHGPEAFTREIIRLCRNKAECAYWEAYYILSNHALLRPDEYYNRFVSVKVNGVGLTPNNFTVPGTI
jgi:hypothetical protein